ncbi:hypothetical protein FSP39_008680 [Pinctada imbricata]|uniref:Mab-21-like HhH/H2TH-like domain-containing protein n=1 Tax=Pinctada imbricata TaxID=66713 RepID=A0AA88YBM2_PINIB|nr:hypothetical protein FSP39_008680 [Pinctada imbricata]
MDLEGYSDTIYSILCSVVGNEDEIKFNRSLCTIWELIADGSHTDMSRENKAKYGLELAREMVRQRLGTVPQYVEANLKILKDKFLTEGLFREWLIYSGSRAEGFDFQSSDHDFMCYMKCFKVLEKPTSQIFDPLQYIQVYLLEKENTKPGFVRLKLQQSLDPRFDCIVHNAVGQNTYLSNKKYKEQFQMLLTHKTGFQQYVHGPCLVPDAQGRIEVDTAPTLCSETWPVDAVGCLHRLLKSKWPPFEVVKEIVSDECLFVPIGCASSPFQEIEWRISFSLAEKRLVHSMNHTQFLTYALLKLFLKDIAGRNTTAKDLLCSYFMKTSVFWEIVETSIPWRSSFILHHFWNCFRRLLFWINSEYCPNFFIPENNMFYGKIHGHARQELMRFLGCVYTEGYFMFHKIPSILGELELFGEVPTMCCNAGLRRSKVIKKLFSVTAHRFHHSIDLLYDSLKSQKSQVILEFTEYIRRSRVNLLLHKTLCHNNKHFRRNRISYQLERKIFRVLKATSPDRTQSMVFIAMHFYRRKQHDRAICMLFNVIRKLEDEVTINLWNFNAEKYSAVGGDYLSVSDGLRRFTASSIPLDAETCLPEIVDECLTPNGLTDYHLISPLVLTHFLLFLCYFRTDDLLLARSHLTELDNVLQNIKIHVESLAMPISWQLLGIGQEMIGDFTNALESLGTCQTLLNFGFNSRYDESLFESNRKRICRVVAILILIEISDVLSTNQL